MVVGRRLTRLHQSKEGCYHFVSTFCTFWPNLHYKSFLSLSIEGLVPSTSRNLALPFSDEHIHELNWLEARNTDRRGTDIQM